MIKLMDKSSSNTEEERQIAIKKAYGTRWKYVLQKSLRMAIIIPLFVIFAEQFILPLFFDAAEFNYFYFTSLALVIDYLWMAAATFLIFALFHLLEWNQSAKIPEEN